MVERVHEMAMSMVLSRIGTSDRNIQPMPERAAAADGVKMFIDAVVYRSLAVSK